MRWRKKLARGEVVLLDGGTGSELQRRGVPMSEASWSGTAVLTHPEVLRAVHADYIAAGADVIITNTFGTARFQLAAGGLGDRCVEANRAAVRLAREARDAAGRDGVAIAGSISNLPPGFEARNYPPPAVEQAGLDELAQLLAESGVDLIALEMMQDTRHSARAMRAALATGLPVWLGVSCRLRPEDGALVSFDLRKIEFQRPLDALIPLGPSVVNVMHSELAAVQGGMAMVRERWSGPMGVYPEIGDFQRPDWRFEDQTTPAALVRHARTWVEHGARLVGGCCGTSPDHIRALADALPDLNAIASLAG